MFLKESTYRILQTLLLAGLGIYLLVKILGGTLYFYINERFLWLIVVGSVVFLLLALAVYLRARTAADSHAHAHAHQHGHGHHHSQTGRVWGLAIVALPLVLGFLVPPKPLDSSALATRGISANAAIGQSGNNQELAVPSDQRTVLDWVRAFNYSSDPQEFAGEDADVIGFVYHDPRLPANQFLVSRFTVNCCVADAFAIGMIVEEEDAADWSGNSWVHVEGSIAVGTLDGRAAPIILAESIKPVPVPPQPYLFP